MKQRLISFLLALVMLLGLLPVGAVPVLQAQAAKADPAFDTLKIDFEALAEDIASESWWQGLPMGSKTKENPPTEEGNAQYAALLDYLEENECWTINETATGISTSVHPKMIFLDTQDQYDWALRYYPLWISDSATIMQRNDLQLDLTVENEGWYKMSAEIFMENMKSTQIPEGIDAGSGYCEIRVNGEPILKQQPFKGENVVRDINAGYVYLNKGVNAVTIHACKDIFIGVGHTRRTLCFNNITFQKLTSLKVDFKEDVLAMSEQSWWADLRDTDVDGIKMIGDTYMSAPTEAEYAAFGELQAYLDRQGIWNIEEGSPVFSDKYNGRLIYLNTTDDDYGIRFYPGILNAADDRDRLILSVQAPEAGLYHFDLTVLNEASNPTTAQVNGSMGRAYGNIYVNGELIYENYPFQATTDRLETVSLGAVELAEGENTVTIEVSRDDSGVNTTVRRSFNLRSMEFIPLNGVQVELGRTTPLDLCATYLVFDAPVTPGTHQVKSDNTNVADAEFAADGTLRITGRSLGTANLTVTTEGATVCTIPLNVVEATTPENGAYYTLDGFKAVLMSYGSTAEGELTHYVDGVPMTEDEVRSAGAVYFTTSDADIAEVDMETGDVTPVGEGIATITAYVLMDGIVTCDASLVTVTDDTDLASMTLSAAVPYVGVDNDLYLQLSGKKSSGANADMSAVAVAYTVDDETVATVTDGRLTGLKAGTVTVTATVGVEGKAVSAEETFEVVENTDLPGEGILLDFTDGRVLDAPSATLEDDGYALVMDQCYNGGSALTFASKVGMSQKAPKDGKLTLDFMVEKDGWYWLETIGGLYTGGTIADLTLDDAYMGTIDFGCGNGGPYSAYSAMNTIYLTAGVHRVQLTNTTQGTIYLGRLCFHETQDPNTVTVSAKAEQEKLLVGQTTQAQVSLQGANGRPQQLLAVSAVPTFTNYYRLTSSAPGVVSVSGNTLTAVKAGSATITVTGKWQTQTISKTFPVTVLAGNVAELTLTGAQTTLRPEADPVQLTLSAFGVDGSAVTLTGAVTYRSENTAVATVSSAGVVTVSGTEGSAKIVASVTQDGRTMEAACWITVTVGKTEPTIYTWEERENAMENALTYDWAISAKESAVKKADYYVDNLDVIYNMWIREGLPRSTRVGLQYTDDAYRYCRYCGVDLVAEYGAYPWIVDPIENPWKVQCPACSRVFPSNDFESYYKSGLTEKGYFDEARADKSLLFNELYPEMGEGWGVDDGWGYYSGTIMDSGKEDVHTYIAYYLHCVFCTIGSSKHSMPTILDALREAYLYTGDVKYGEAGAILLDRIADIYPEYDRANFSTAFPNSDGGSYFGKFVGCIWEAETIGTALALAADAFWPCMDSERVVEYLRNQCGTHMKNMEPEDITPAYIRENVENGVLLEIKKACEDTKMSGNFGMQQSAIAYAAVALDRMPETQEMLDWAFRFGERKLVNGKYESSGGAVLYHLVELVDRDGFGNEVSYQYNALWYINLLDLADALKDYDKAEGVDLWSNPKFVNMLSAMSRYGVCGRLTPQAGEAGFVQSTHKMGSVQDLTTAFMGTGNRELARHLYAANGNTVKGLHADIFTEDPESSLQEQIMQIVNADGVWDQSESNMMSGFGIAILREGPEMYIKGVNEQAFSDYWMYFGKTGGGGHAQLEALNLDLEAFGLGMSSSMGYPVIVSSGDAERMQWVRNTVSHNTVVVNDKGQSEMVYGGFPLHFEDSGKVKLMDADASKAYPETDIYRRTVVTVAAENGVHYAVDFFRVLGGSEHVYSFHAATGLTPETQGLSLVHQPMGTYAGPGIPYGPHWVTDSQDPSLNMGSGYSWLDNVYRDAKPADTFTVNFEIEDFQDYLPDSEGIGMKFTMLPNDPLTEVAIADGHPPQNGRNPETMKYVLVRRSGADGMDSLFTSIIEPYKHDELIASAELAQMVLTEGTPKITDRTAAIKVTLVSGRVDYIVYATNPDCLYTVKDADGTEKFTFQGFTGVASFDGDVLTYGWGSEVTTLGSVITDAQSEVTGTVAGFTEGLADNYYLTVTMDEPVTAEELEGRYVFVSNDGERNAAYRIYGAQVSGSTATLDLYTQTLVRSYVDKENMDLGYVHNIAEGQSYTIPLSAEGTCAHSRNSVSYIPNGDGTHTVTRTCVACGQISSANIAACKDGTDSDTKCDRCKEPMPVQIATAQELMDFAARVNGGENTLSAVLTADIDLAGFDWTPMGTAQKPYRGTFVGGGFTIRNMTIDHDSTSADSYVGLFGAADGAVIKKLTVQGSIHVSAEPVTTSRIGGIVGSAANTTMEDCVGIVSITGKDGAAGYYNVGGLVGYATDLTMTRCGNEADLTILGYNMGGLVGHVPAGDGQTVISQSFNHGDLLGNQRLGGLVGTFTGSSNAATPNTIVDCYNAGDFNTVSADGTHLRQGGGIIGSSASGNITVKNCYVSGSTADAGSNTNDAVIYAGVKTTLSGIDNVYYLESIGTTQSAAKSRTEVQLRAESFVAVLGSAFKQTEDGYPALQWECDHETEVTYTSHGDGTHTASADCTICGKPVFVKTESCTDANKDNTCDTCGGKLKTVVKTSVAGSNMNLGNELQVNFIVNNPVEGDYVAYIHQDTDDEGGVVYEIPEEEWEAFGTTRQKIAIRVRAMEMTDTLTLTIKDVDGYDIIDAYATSVRDYAAKALTAASSTAQMKTLVVDMVNYGAAAQTNFSYKATDLANNQLTDAQKALATASVTCSNNQIKGTNNLGANLALDDCILLNVFFSGFSKRDVTKTYAKVT
ncbi:MAG: Ig-like domain-containing protein, partial [Oscillospiraceae bacterium]|nr:Ig-like domain-containing protein [Oscillospiraceae bacterium]